MYSPPSARNDGAQRLDYSGMSSFKLPGGWTFTPSGTVVPSGIITGPSLADHSVAMSKLTAQNYYSVYDYGAVGDGNTDDTTALQNCINAAIATGGVVLLGARHKISAALTITSSGTHPIRIEGLGWIARASQSNSGSVIYTASNTQDVFIVDSDPGGGVEFKNFGVDRENLNGNAAASGGVTFKVLTGTNVVWDTIYTIGSYDDIQTGKSGINVCNQQFVTNYVCQDVVRYGVNVVGIIGNLMLRGCYYGGQAASYTAQTSVFLNFAFGANADIIDPIYISDVDVEQFASGILHTGGKGNIAEMFLSSVILDGPTKCAIRITGGANAGASTIHITNSWITSSGTTPTATLFFNGGGTDGSIVGVRISNTTIEASAGCRAIYWGNGARDLSVTGCHIGGSGVAGIDIAGVPGGSDVTISGNKFGAGYGGANAIDVMVEPGAAATVESVAITGNACRGTTTACMYFQGGASGVMKAVSCVGNALEPAAGGYGFLVDGANSVVFGGLNISDNAYSGDTGKGGKLQNVGDLTNVKISNNGDFNPFGAGITTPGIPGSGVAVTNQQGVDVMVYLTTNAAGGCAVSVDSSNTITVLAGQNVASFLLPAGGAILLTFTQPPTWVWSGL